MKWNPNIRIIKLTGSIKQIPLLDQIDRPYVAFKTAQTMYYRDNEAIYDVLQIWLLFCSVTGIIDGSCTTCIWSNSLHVTDSWGDFHLLFVGLLARSQSESQWFCNLPSRHSFLGFPLSSRKRWAGFQFPNFNCMLLMQTSWLEFSKIKTLTL